MLYYVAHSAAVYRPPQGCSCHLSLCGVTSGSHSGSLGENHTVFSYAFGFCLYSLVATKVHCDFSLRPAMQRRMRLIVGFDVGFVGYQVTLGLAFLRVRWSSLASIIPSMFHARLFIYHLPCIILVAESVVR